MTANKDMLQQINADLEYYEVALTSTVLAENGEYITDPEGTDIGYALVNKITGIVEHTSMLLPAVVFQSTHFDNTLKSLLSKDEKAPASLDNMPVDDVIPN